MNKATYDVFISYSSKDQKIVEGLSAYLEQNKIRCFVDFRLLSGEAMKNSKMMVFIFSENSNLAPSVDREIEVFSRENKPVLLFKIDNTKYKGVKEFHLANLYHIDAFPDPEKWFKELYETIKHLLPELKNEKPPLPCSLHFDPETGEFCVSDPLDPSMPDSWLPITDMACDGFAGSEAGEFCDNAPESKGNTEATDQESENAQNMSSFGNAAGQGLANIPSALAGTVFCAASTAPILVQCGMWMGVGALLGRCLFAKQDDSHLSLCAPSKLICGEDMLVQIFLHGENSIEAVLKKAQMKDSQSSLRGNESLGITLKKGDEIEIKLIMPQGIKVDEAVQKTAWKNDLNSVDFVVSVPSSYKLGDMIGTVTICKDSLPLCSVKFVTKIVQQIDGNVPHAEIHPVFYKKVFVSYSSADREEVMKIATGFKALHVDFFLDKLYLDGGDKYEDKIFDYIEDANLFLLCWSSNAEQSEWVKKEYTYALQRINRPDMLLSIYPIIIKPKANPPTALNAYHFVEL